MSDSGQETETLPATLPETSVALPESVEDLMVKQWLDETTKNSKQTEAAYKMVMKYFRQHLKARNLDVFSEDTKAVAFIASEYARTSYDRRGRVREGKLSESTINQRLAILSSFYTFCHTWEPRITNPIDRCKREKRNVHDAAPHLETTEVESVLKSIPRTSTLKGKRDYALLLLAFTTGRRAAELTALVWGDFRIVSKRIHVTWRHCKGNKTMKDILGEGTRDALIEYLTALYGSLELPSDTPIFVSLSHNNHGQTMTTQAVADVCRKYVGTSKIHTTRHTFAINSELAGATLSEIGERLGHGSLKTTSDYMKRLHSEENKHIKKLESLYGL